MSKCLNLNELYSGSIAIRHAALELDHCCHAILNIYTSEPLPHNAALAQ